MESSPSSIVIFGASGDLARKKLYPALFELFRLGHISTNCIIVGFSRTALSTENFRRNIKNTLESQNYVGEAFLTKCFYFCGDYQTLGSFHDLEYFLSKNETLAYQQVNHNRLFYLSTPPELFIPIAYNASISCKSNYGWNRLIIEKPFGNSLSNAVKMYDELMTCNWSPHELFHIDHYLGKDIIQKLFVFRFANTMFEPLLNNKYVAAVKISIDEDVGTIGRSSYFENYGIICDMLQSHLVQLLTLITMDIPEDIDACNISDCISDAKVDILRAMRPLSLGDIVLGQYVGNDNGKGGYLDDPSVRFDSRTPTFAQAICHVNTPRWEGVPFILKTGKALERQKGDIRVQLKDPPSARRIFDGTQIPRNEIVFRISPEDKINLEVNVSRCGWLATTELEQKVFCLEPNVRASSLSAHARLILDCFNGSHSGFVRCDEFMEAWKVFDDVLREIQENLIVPISYTFGSSGPLEATLRAAEAGYK